MKGTLPAQIDITSEPDTADSDSESVIWRVISHCWAREPEGRPKSKEILDELHRAGIVGGVVEDQEQIVQETRHFRDAMRKNEEVLIDLDKIETILDTIEYQNASGWEMV